MFVLVHVNQNSDLKEYNALRYYIPKGIVKNYNINGKYIHDQPTDSKIKQYEEIQKLATGQGEDYTAGCFLDYKYIKNHYKLIAVDLKRKKN